MTALASSVLRLEYEVRGTGDPVLFIAGLNDDRNGWAEVVPGVEPHYQCLVFDNRDAGASPRAEGPYTLGDMAADTVAVLDRAGIDRAHVVGHSMGGAIAQALALRAPERVRSLVLIDTWAKWDAYGAAAIASWKTGVRKLTAGEFAHSAIYFWLGETAINEMGPEELAKAFAPAVEAQGADALCRQADACIAADTSTRLAEISAPTLVVWGVEDRITLEPLALQLHEGIKGSRYVRIERSGHSPTVEQPAALYAAILDFLATVP